MTTAKKPLPDPVLTRDAERRALHGRPIKQRKPADPDRVRNWYSPCTLGLEEVLHTELEDLGATAIEEGRGGVRFRGNLGVGYAANLWLRTGIRVQEELVTGSVDSPEQLYDLARTVDWGHSITPENTLAVDAFVRDSVFRDGRYAGQVVKDAVVDRLRDETGNRPSVERRTPDLPIRLMLKGDYAALYRDLSGLSLHKRGYRPIQVKSPLNESIAAGLVLLTGWRGESPMVDPMCGSATFCIEAAMIAGDVAPGLRRDFAMENWLDFDEELWHDLREEAKQRLGAGRENIPPIEGADRHPGAVAIALKSVKKAGFARNIPITECDVGEFTPAHIPGLVCVNPPYGERIAWGADLERSWRDLGDFLHQKCPGARAFVLSGEPGLSQLLHLKAKRKYPVMNGPIECRWLGYRINAGADEPDAP